MINIVLLENNQMTSQSRCFKCSISQVIWPEEKNRKHAEGHFKYNFDGGRTNGIFYLLKRIWVKQQSTERLIYVNISDEQTFSISFWRLFNKYVRKSFFLSKFSSDWISWNSKNMYLSTRLECSSDDPKI